jgi:hypothetical protein
VAESVKFHPLSGGYAILSGQHRFYAQEAGDAEHLDGQAEFIASFHSETDAIFVEDPYREFPAPST